jgi:RNA polymerase sigma-70 factor, ECF subfamily
MQGMRGAAVPDPVIEDLVRRAQAGEMPAFNSLVLRYQDAVYSLALRMLGSPAAAEDAAQEAFIRAYRRLETFRGGNFRSWLFSIVANLSRDELRRRARRPQLSLDAARDDPDRADLDPVEPGPGPEAVAEQAELRALLEAALLTLPDDWREVVVLSDVQGLAYEEIAQVTGLALGTVKSRLSRARAHLRDTLRASGELSSAYGRLEDRR